MTDETEARRLAMKFHELCDQAGCEQGEYAIRHEEEMESEIAAALTAAREAEREKWAKQADASADGWGVAAKTHRNFARRLRENKEPAE